MIKNGLVASGICIVGMLALSLWAMPQLPADGQFASHWNIKGEADGFSGRNTVLWLMPLLALGMTALMSLLPIIDPRRKNLLRSSLPYQIAWIGMMMILAFAHTMMVLNAAKIIDLTDVSNGPGMLRWIAVLTGLFVAALGAVMGKIRPNWFLGVRTPWTLSSDLSWDKTHRLTGWLFMFTGLATTLSALFAFPLLAFVLMVAGTVLSALCAITYSFFVWKNDPARETLVPESVE